MKHIVEDIFKGIDRTKKHKPVELDLYPLSEELFDEFERMGMIDRLKSVPQLGSIAINNCLSKTRYDYLILQLWLHKKTHDLINEILEYSYASTMHKEDFAHNFPFSPPHEKPTVEEFIQTFSLVYNIGHCCNTFLASRAMIFALQQSIGLFESFVSQFDDPRIRPLIRKLIDTENYHHFHLLNSILVLEQCDETLFSVKIAKELIFSYFSISTCSKKLKYVFNLFKKIRNFSITTFDLQLDHTPFRIRLTNDNSLKKFLTEYLEKYNDNQKSIQLVESLTKLLSTFIYNEERRVIKTYYIAKGIGKKLIRQGINDYYNSLFLNIDSPINKKPSSSLNIDTNYMKLTFCHDESTIAQALLNKLDHMNNVRAAKYNRHDGHSTIIVSVNKKHRTNKALQLRILKTVVSHLRKLPGIKNDDIRYLIASKYFLSHFLNNRRIRINPTGEYNNKNICTYCIKGAKAKQNELSKHLSFYNDEGEKHEIENMINFLLNDTKRDLSLLIPASIVVFDVSGSNTDVEFDGFVINPWRVSDQLIFLEAKVSRAAGNAKRELRKKLIKLGFEVNPNDIIRTGNDAFYNYTII